LVSQQTNFLFELPHGSRNFGDDHWRDYDLAIINLWKAAKGELANWHFAQKNGSVTIDISWSPVIRRKQRHYRVMQRLEAALGTSKVDEIIREFSHAKIQIPCTVSIESPKARTRVSSSFLEYLLYDFFLIMNIAVPGSCNFYGGVIRSKDQPYDPEISLSSYFFETAHLRSQSNRWPPTKILPLSSVHKWFFAVRNDVRQVPKSRMERVLFGLMQLAIADVTPTTFIWLFYALETLFDTKAGENSRSLVERIKLLLGPNDKEFKLLRKNLSELYGVRSAFVHGGLGVIHPMHDETLDPEAEKSYVRFLELADFGFIILLAAVQEVVSKNWTDLRFEETLHGQALQN
jgi:hypothetical protein